MYQGGDNIKKMEWADVNMIIHRGGTIIGSARCMKFRERKGRLQAAENLLKCKITNLIACGGDGSLTGANLFRLEWPSLLEELVAEGRVTQALADECSYLNLVGLVGSIDNDMVYEGDLTIGTDTALNRIVESIDAVTTTAASHLRTFVMEVMGRYCGYLAWAAGIATAADFVLIPESPPDVDNWEEVMCSKLAKRRSRGQRLCLVIVAEGAIDRHGKEISAEHVKNVIVERLQHDTRITILGHVQRGGQTSAYDRLMATITSAAAVEKVLVAKQGDPATIVGMKGSKCIFAPLVETVQATQKVAELTINLNFAGAIKQRGKNFDRDYAFHLQINGTDVRLADGVKAGEHGVGLVHVGAPAAGLNSATRATTRYMLNHGWKVFGVSDGFQGLAEGRLKELGWIEVGGWHMSGGSRLGVNRKLPNEVGIEQCVATIKANNLNALFIHGGFEAFNAAVQLKEAREKHPELNIPILVIPCTISNNVPGTDWSLGSDTALNAVCDAIDRTKVSASSSKHRVFLVETQGANCGFLAGMSALASGAHKAWVPEESCCVADLKTDIEMIRNRVSRGGQYSVIVKNDKCNASYDLDFFTSLYSQEAQGKFSVRDCSLGHLCQGMYPSPLDRVRSAQLAAFAVETVLKSLNESGDKPVGVVGHRDGSCRMTSIDELLPEADCEKRVWKKQWFLKYLPLVGLLSGYELGVDGPKVLHDMFDMNE
ncbi:hypothetical protein SARC_00462 [Sphaeroforma arctica JP610]|uniref:6-phosphofructokinase n=1 Tax=Sphaeroforma arctica JP610 TaxID=667725 RepID=A0A0L0GEI5_9EUKA|nr:hypothetical protein SARC_00462 [Sphaeroforma arctica JP610]KNC87425.1 hypothetical protein SARC_00462 [Sphaeroforma arctica JP610]|eukprot:XP_014161327.1 hypothetical protein SARC_00462 [Sphaeroforma arctica JP610]